MKAEEQMTSVEIFTLGSLLCRHSMQINTKTYGVQIGVPPESTSDQIEILGFENQSSELRNIGLWSYSKSNGVTAIQRALEYIEDDAITSWDMEGEPMTDVDQHLIAIILRYGAQLSFISEQTAQAGYQVVVSADRDKRIVTVGRNLDTGVYFDIQYGLTRHICDGFNAIQHVFDNIVVDAWRLSKEIESL